MNKKKALTCKTGLCRSNSPSPLWTDVAPTTKKYKNVVVEIIFLILCELRVLGGEK